MGEIVKNGIFSGLTDILFYFAFVPVALISICYLIYIIIEVIKEIRKDKNGKER